MKRRLRWGILGTGSIARVFAEALTQSRTGELAAVGSSSPQRARDFSASLRFSRDVFAGSYEEAIHHESVEAIYVATLNRHHVAHACAAAHAGRHVLCEKPLALNAQEGSRIITAAREAGVFLMEAFAYRCHPQTQRLLELIGDGAIGQLRHIIATFPFFDEPAPASRLRDAIGGGVILDVGCYPLSMARLLAGAEPEFRGVTARLQDGVEISANALLRFPDGLTAQVSCGSHVAASPLLQILGEKGMLQVPDPWLPVRNGGKGAISWTRHDSSSETIHVPAESSPYTLEADYVAEHLTGHESPAMTWADSLSNLRALDEWRRLAAASPFIL